MAELLLKVGDGSGYTDGDCLCVFNRRHRLCIHAQHICNVKTATRNGDGLILTTDVAFDWFNLTKQYRFERVSPSEVDRVDIATSARERFGPTHIDVGLYLTRRKQIPLNQIFGEAGAEVWFGGRTDVAMPAVSSVWDAIETKTPRVRTQPRFRHWPMGRQDIRAHLPIRMESLNEAEVRQWLRPSYQKRPNGKFRWRRVSPATGELEFSWSVANPDEGGPDEREWRKVIRRKRRHRVQWRNMLADLAETEANIVDKSYPVGEEIDEDGRTGYRSKTQNDQLKSRVEDQGDTT